VGVRVEERMGWVGRRARALQRRRRETATLTDWGRARELAPFYVGEESDRTVFGGGLRLVRSVGIVTVG